MHTVRSQENYMWQWRSFLNTGSAGLFLFGYSFVYFSSTLEIMGVVSTMLYFTYMFVASMMFTLVTGTVGSSAPVLPMYDFGL